MQISEVDLRSPAVRISLATQKIRDRGQWKMEPMSATKHTFQVFIENSAGSSIKNSCDEKTLRLIGQTKVSRPYPYPYGFVLNTQSGDGDSVDCFVITKRILHTGDVLECAPVHLLEQIEDGEVDHKVLCVPAASGMVVDDRAVADIRAFVMLVFSHIPGKKMQLGSLLGAAQAMEFVKKCSL